MVWRRFVATIWFFAIPIALWFSLMMQSRARKRERDLVDVVIRIDQALKIWADSWGESTVEVKQKLQALWKK